VSRATYLRVTCNVGANTPRVIGWDRFVARCVDDLARTGIHGHLWWRVCDTLERGISDQGTMQLQGNMRLRRYSHLQLHVAVPAYSQVTHSVRVMQLQLPALADFCKYRSNRYSQFTRSHTCSLLATQKVASAIFSRIWFPRGLPFWGCRELNNFFLAILASFSNLLFRVFQSSSFITKTKTVLVTKSRSSARALLPLRRKPRQPRHPRRCMVFCKRNHAYFFDKIKHLIWVRYMKKHPSKYAGAT